jgi:hypothetical protein
VENAQLTGIGAADTAYTIQASTNLLNWQAIGTGTAGTNGIFQLNDTNMDQFSRRFYRVAPQ